MFSEQEVQSPSETSRDRDFCVKLGCPLETGQFNVWSVFLVFGALFLQAARIHQLLEVSESLVQSRADYATWNNERWSFEIQKALHDKGVHRKNASIRDLLFRLFATVHKYDSDPAAAGHHKPPYYDELKRTFRTHKMMRAPRIYLPQSPAETPESGKRTASSPKYVTSP